MIKFYEDNYNKFNIISSKNKNDESNKLREKLIQICFENYKNIDFNPTIGKNMFNNLCLLLEQNNFDKILDIQHIGGLKANDFIIKYLCNNEEKIINIDFKFNVVKISKLAQVKQIYTTDKKMINFIKINIINLI